MDLVKRRFFLRRLDRSDCPPWFVECWGKEQAKDSLDPKKTVGLRIGFRNSPEDYKRQADGISKIKAAFSDCPKMTNEEVCHLLLLSSLGNFYKAQRYGLNQKRLLSERDLHIVAQEFLCQKKLAEKQKSVPVVYWYTVFSNQNLYSNWYHKFKYIPDVVLCKNTSMPLLSIVKTHLKVLFETNESPDYPKNLPRVYGE